MHGSMGGSWKRNKLWQPIHGGPWETEGPEPGPTYSPSPRQLPTRPTSDERVLRLISTWLDAGVIEDGKWTASEGGAPQGTSASPLLANV